jgi:hypothetical protein
LRTAAPALTDAGVGVAVAVGVLAASVAGVGPPWISNPPDTSAQKPGPTRPARYSSSPAAITGWTTRLAVKALTWSVTGQPTAPPPARSAGTGSCGASVPPWAVPSLVPRYLSARALRVVAARVDRRAFNRRELSFKARLTGRSSRKA